MTKFKVGDVCVNKVNKTIAVVLIKPFFTNFLRKYKKWHVCWYDCSKMIFRNDYAYESELITPDTKTAK